MRESVKIIQQALDGMPEGPVKADAPKIVLPDREKMKTQMEALIHHFKIVTEGFAVPAGEVYQGIEAGRRWARWALLRIRFAPQATARLASRSILCACTCAIRRSLRCRRLETMCKGRCWLTATRGGRGDWVDRYCAGGD
jgi:hypothetical protein